jgi:hypothetical protein
MSEFLFEPAQLFDPLPPLMLVAVPDKANSFQAGDAFETY